MEASLVLFGVVALGGQTALGVPVACDNITWIAYDDRCFLLEKEVSRDYYEAETFCDRKGAFLANLKDQDSLSWFQHTFGFNGPTYIGLHAARDGNLYWSDGGHKGKFSKWPGDAYGYVKGTTKSKCVVLRMGFWYTAECNMKGFALCEKRDSNPCKNNNGGCKHLCEIAKSGLRKCECTEGYQIVQGVDCIDIDECENENGFCEQICTNYKGGWNCSCQEHFILEGETCIELKDILDDLFFVVSIGLALLTSTLAMCARSYIKHMMDVLDELRLEEVEDVNWLRRYLINEAGFTDINPYWGWRVLLNKARETTDTSATTSDSSAEDENEDNEKSSNRHTHSHAHSGHSHSAHSHSMGSSDL